MSDTSTADTGTGTDDATDTGTDDGTDTGGDTTDNDPVKEAEKWKALARRHEERAKKNASAAKELEELRRSSMSDTERAVAEAREAGKAEARVETGRRLVSAELRAAAAGRLDADQLAEAVEHLDLASFLDDDGDVDSKKVAKFVDAVAPRGDDDEPDPTRRKRDLGQGARGGSSLPLNGDPLERALKDKLGIR